MFKAGSLKKLACALALSAALSAGAVCAASDSGDLASQQKTADVFIDAVDGSGAPEYAAFSKGLSAELKTSLTEKAYADLQKQVKDKFGTIKETKFFSYERYDQGDRITYLASFSRQPVVTMTFMFDNSRKLINFALTPVNTEQTGQQPDAAQ